MNLNPDTHSSVALSHWDSFVKKVQDGEESIAIDGHKLEVASVVAVSR